VPPQPKFPWGAGGEITTNQAIGSLRESLKTWLKDERGIHVETLLLTIGAIAGFAGQCAAIERVLKKEPFPENAFVQVKTKSGETFFMGDLINGYLIAQKWSEYPLWGFLTAVAVEAGIPSTELPDTNEMFRFIASTIGSGDFKVPRVPIGHVPRLQPRQALEIFWPRARHIFTRRDGPGTQGQNVPTRLWPVVAGVVANQLVMSTKHALDPRLGIRIIMESAIAMSKVDPKTVPQAMPQAMPQKIA
jgi:hypothetical protein